MPARRQDDQLRAKLVALLATTVVLSGCAALTGNDAPGLSGLGTGDIAVRAGDAVVTADELQASVDEAMAAGALQSEQLSGSELERQVQLQAIVLNNDFQVELAAVAAAEQFGVEVTEADLDAAVDVAVEEAGGRDALEVQLASSGQSLALFRRGQRVAILLDRITEALIDDQPLTDEEVAAAFESRRADFEQASVSHILVDTEAEADAVLERIAAGEDFAELAGELSQDPASAAAGGSLGLAPRGSYVPPFEAAIWDGPAEVGELVGPIETDFGWHVLRVDEFAVTPPDEAQRQVRAELAAQRGQELFGTWFQDLLSSADVEVAGRFGRWDDASLRILRDDVPSGQQ